MGKAHRTAGSAQTQPPRGPTTRSGHGIRIVLLGVVLAAALGLLAVGPTHAKPADPTCCNPDTREAFVFSAHFSGGRLHLTVKFHTAGKFFAQFLFHPRSHGTTRPTRTIPLGFHAAGKARISVRLGTLTPGRWAVAIAPQHIFFATSQSQVGTYVYFTIQHSGRLTGIKLVTATL